MTLGVRKLIVAATVVAVLLLANAVTVVQWLEETGALKWARGARAEYLNGTTLTILVVFMFLFVPTTTRLVTRCRVCEHVLLRQGRYCPRCGSKL